MNPQMEFFLEEIKGEARTIEDIISDPLATIEWCWRDQLLAQHPLCPPCGSGMVLEQDLSRIDLI